MPSSSLTLRSILPEARHVVIPDGITSTSFPAVQATCSALGIEFDDWQVELNRLIEARGSDGDYAADTVAMSICRQAGKTYDVGALVFADSIINPHTTTVWTAHRFPVSRESFNELRGLARLPAMAAHIDFGAITTAAGNECIPFRNGSRILFKARERGAIRGFTKVKRIILDEAQILTEAAMADMAPTQNQAANPQIIMLGTPPKPSDPGEVFRRLRSEALSGEAEGTLWVEFAADPTADTDDREAWEQANPSYPKRTPTKRITRLLRLLGEEDFRREGLGIWDDDSAVSVVSLDRWAELVDVESVRPDPVVFVVEVSPDRKWGSICLAGRRSDGGTHVQVVESQRGATWMAKRVVELSERWSPSAVVVRTGSPSASLIPALSEAGIEPAPLSPTDFGAACGMFADMIADGSIRHDGQPVLEVAIRGARERRRGESKVWEPKGETDVSPLLGVVAGAFVLAREASRVVSPKRSGVVL